MATAVKSVFSHWCGSIPCSCRSPGICLFKTWLQAGAQGKPRAQSWRGPVDVVVTLPERYETIGGGVGLAVAQGVLAALMSASKPDNPDTIYDQDTLMGWAAQGEVFLCGQVVNYGTRRMSGRDVEAVMATDAISQLQVADPTVAYVLEKELNPPYLGEVREKVKPVDSLATLAGRLARVCTAPERTVERGLVEKKIRDIKFFMGNLGSKQSLEPVEADLVNPPPIFPRDARAQQVDKAKARLGLEVGPFTAETVKQGHKLLLRETHPDKYPAATPAEKDELATLNRIVRAAYEICCKQLPGGAPGGRPGVD